MFKSNIVKSAFLSLICTLGLQAGEPLFIDYQALTKSLIQENKKSGNFASTEEVKKAIASKDWIVADVRTAEEWAAAQIKGTVRVGREAPEKHLSNLVLDENNKFTKPNMIVICNSAARASLMADIFRKMGFTTVKIYDIYTWIDECNPVVTNYTVHNDKEGTGLNFGSYYAEHCKNKVDKK